MSACWTCCRWAGLHLWLEGPAALLPSSGGSCCGLSFLL